MTHRPHPAPAPALPTFVFAIIRGLARQGSGPAWPVSDVPA